jgi:hypothetical protein
MLSSVAMVSMGSKGGMMEYFTTVNPSSRRFRAMASISSRGNWGAWPAGFRWPYMRTLSRQAPPSISYTGMP